MKNKTKIYAMLIAFSMVSIFGASAAIADSSDVTTTWIVPADTTIATLLPTALGILCAIFFVTGILLIFVVDALADEPEMYYKP